MANCTSCGASGAYLGLVKIECPNAACQHFVPAQAEALVLSEPKGNTITEQTVSDAMYNIRDALKNAGWVTLKSRAGFPPGRVTSVFSAPPTDEEVAGVMTQRGIPIDRELYVRLATEHSILKPSKYIYSLLDHAQEDGKIHPQWRRNELGRWFSRSPNIFNVSYHASKALGGKWFCYRNLEVHTFGHLSQSLEVMGLGAQLPIGEELAPILGVPSREAKEAFYSWLWGARKIPYTVRAKLAQHFPGLRHGLQANREAIALGATVVNDALHRAYRFGMPVLGVWHDTLILSEEVDDQQVLKVMDQVQHYNSTPYRIR